MRLLSTRIELVDSEAGRVIKTRDIVLLNPDSEAATEEIVLAI